MKLTYAQALVRAIRDALVANPKVFLVGSGFVALSTNGRAAFAPLFQEFEDRVVAAPVSELGIAGAGTGAALSGCRPLVDLGSGSFTFQAWAQVVNEAPNIHYMTGGQAGVPVTWYALVGIRGSGAAQHSHRVQSMLGNVPGLQILLPATPSDAYQMLTWAMLESNNPTAFLTHSLLLDDEEEIDFARLAPAIGKARVARPGKDATIIAYSVTVGRALAAAELLASRHGISAEVIDMRSLCPLDRETMIGSVIRTGRAVIADECHLRFGAGAELAAVLAEEAFAGLKAPVRRVATPDAPIPYSPVLESALVITPEKIAEGVLAVCDYKA